MADFENVFGNQVATPFGRFVFFDLESENTQAKHPLNKYPSDRFDVTLIFEKGADFSALRAECERVAQQAFKKVEGIEMPFANGDEKSMDCMKGHIVVRAKSKKKPGLVDEHKSRMNSEEEMRSGMWGRIIVSPFSYTSGRTKGVTLLLKKAQVCLDRPYDVIGIGGADADFDDSASGGSPKEDSQPF